MPRAVPSDKPHRPESFDPAQVEQRALALFPETRREYAHHANQLRANAVETCPTCLYNVSGVLNGDETRTCPECGSPTSRPINTLIWGERSNACGINRTIARFSGLAVGGLYWIAMIGATVMERMSGVFEFFMFLTIIGIFGLPVGVSFAAYRWLRLRDPTMNGVNVFVVAILAGIANTAAAILLVYIANAVLRYF